MKDTSLPHNLSMFCNHRVAMVLVASVRIFVGIVSFCTNVMAPHSQNPVSSGIASECGKGEKPIQELWPLWIVYIGVVFKAITLATATRDSHYCTCLGHLGHWNRDRIISIYVALPKVAKASKVYHCRVPLSLTLSCQLSPMETRL
jgi:hypothetical protein